jgi:hypothetical protein
VSKRPSPFIAVNLGIRFLLEIGMLLALAWAGIAASWDYSQLLGLVLALAFTMPAALAWGIWIAPKAARRLADPARLLFELALFAAATVAFAYAGSLVLALVFAVLVVANTAVLRLYRVEH